MFLAATNQYSPIKKLINSFDTDKESIRKSRTASFTNKTRKPFRFVSFVSFRSPIVFAVEIVLWRLCWLLWESFGALLGSSGGSSAATFGLCLGSLASWSACSPPRSSQTHLRLHLWASFWSSMGCFGLSNCLHDVCYWACCRKSAWALDACFHALGMLCV